MNMLKDKVALITGGSRGIGRAIAIKFAEHGANVAINYTQDDEAAKEVICNAEGKGLKMISIKGNVSSIQDVKRMVEEAKKRFGGIDILVNNAGIKKDAFLMMMMEKNWDDVIRVNLKGTFLCTKEVIKTMISRKSGKIINLSSVSGVVGQPGQTNYAASKSGIIGFTKALAREVARFDILVNAIAPGFIKTDMLKDVPEEILEESVKVIPLLRFGRAEEVANAALFLASDMSSYMTGQVLHIDGGQVM